MVTDPDGPAELLWRDGLGTLFVLVPDDLRTAANIRQMSRLRRHVLRAWLAAAVELIDSTDVEEKP